MTVADEGQVAELTERLRTTEANLVERIDELEFELEAQGWRRLGAGGNREFTREGLREIAKRARLYFIKNPLIRRGVLTVSNYVFGQGVTIQGRSPAVDSIVQAFLADEANQAELTTPSSMQARDIDLWLDGGLFFALFTNKVGDVRVRSILADEIEEIVTNPEDSKEPWYYVRKTLATNAAGMSAGAIVTRLYPDWRYRPKTRPATYSYGGENVKVEWETPVFHVAVNRLNGQRFGTPETYAAHDWAQAYNKFLSDWATLVRSLSKFAWKLTTKGGQEARTAAKTKIDSGLSTGASTTTPSPSAGSVFVNTADSSDLTPIPKTGATVSAEDGRRLLLMVAASMGLPETFFGDASVGTLATARSLDRPTELMCLNRQRLWASILESILTYAIEQKARFGTIPGFDGYEEEGPWDELVFRYGQDPDTGEDIDPTIEVSFPDLVERNVVERVDAVVKATTLGGLGTPAGTLQPEYVTKQLLIALGEKSVEEILEEMYPEDEGLPESLREDAVKIRETMRAFLEATTKDGGTSATSH